MFEGQCSVSLEMLNLFSKDAFVQFSLSYCFVVLTEDEMFHLIDMITTKMKNTMKCAENRICLKQCTYNCATRISQPSVTSSKGRLSLYSLSNKTFKFVILVTSQSFNFDLKLNEFKEI